MTLTIALSDGWSLDGNQVAAPIGSAITVDQSSPRSTHPPSPMSPPAGDELPVRPGDPEYATTTVVVSPSESWRSGVTTISRPSRANVASASSTVTFDTSKPNRSRWKLRRSSVGTSVIVAVASSRSGPAMRTSMTRS